MIIANTTQMVATMMSWMMVLTCECQPDSLRSAVYAPDIRFSCSWREDLIEPLRGTGECCFVNEDNED